MSKPLGGINDSILSKPLYAFNLPQPLLDALTVRALPNTESEVTPSYPAVTESTPPSTVAGASLTCQTCIGATFDGIDEQRAHFKSDWHRYNAKVALGAGGQKNQGVLTAEEFEEINDGLSSLSGSASSSGTENTSPNADSTDRVSKLLRKQRLNGAAAPNENDDDSLAEAEEAEYRRRAELRTAVIWFKPDLKQDTRLIIPADTQLGIYRIILPGLVHNPADFLPALRSIQSPLLPPNAENDPLLERKYTLLMVAGGHFAGMVVSLKPLNLVHGKGLKPEKQDVKGAGSLRILQHKTFHRYTTRKKQGGSQGLNDQAKSKANSAGAMLRRYGEQSLMEEIQALMIEWQDDIHTSEKIFLRASTHGKRSFYGYQGAVLEKTDERIKVFPFPTRRPTQSELIRCFHELTQVKISHLSEEAIKALEDAYIASLRPKIAPTVQAPQLPTVIKPVVPKLSPEEEAYRDRRRRLLDMVRKGRMEPLAPFWDKHAESFGGVNARMEDWVEDGKGQTLLMVASQSGQEAVVKWLLEDLRADPSIAMEAASKVTSTNGSDVAEKTGRTAYDMASTRDIRNVFRRLAHANPDWHDWTGAAHVPSGLSEEQEQEQERKKADRRKAMKDKAREREARKAAEAPIATEEPPKPAARLAPPTTGPQKLGGGKTGGPDHGLVGLTPEMRAKIERERRARAAEARLGGR